MEIQNICQGVCMYGTYDVHGYLGMYLKRGVVFRHCPKL